ncbi:glycosyltransferase family 9 protein [Sphingomonas prati]|uniref:glycosyltransferase family 9 protein n=1 Tax=Sphingomonas prati TaxID=1843237 RepID=UPI001619A06E|nr:glycosyltransferase family 9 protein [Sphingomonas prati]
MDLLLDGIRICCVALDRGTHVPGSDRLSRHVFNVWVDFGDLTSGRHDLELRFFDDDDTASVRTHHERVVVATPLDEATFANSDAVLHLPPGDGPLETRVAARPTMVRPARRPPLLQPPRAVLVQRMDQLGDLAISVPALLRLRALFPDARIVGLVTPANADLARTMTVFDDIVVAEFPDGTGAGHRVMTLTDQIALRDRLAGFAFEIAIDLSESSASRALLPLSGAPFLYGFGSGEFRYLTAQVEGYTHDRSNRHETVPHGLKLVALVEWLATLLGDHAVVVRRPELDRARLGTFGIGEAERYVVLHDGARLPFARWQHYADLATMVQAETGLRVVLITDGSAHDADDGIVRIGGRIPFDDFDALLSFCDAFVGNDSGPKHLAALRGVPVISLHMARTNWGEWGQEGRGVILSRKVPCAGCLIAQDPGLCGKQFACITDIAPREVLAALQDILGASLGCANAGANLS